MLVQEPLWETSLQVPAVADPQSSKVLVEMGYRPKAIVQYVAAESLTGKPFAESFHLRPQRQHAKPAQLG